jgi:hypothetical protein
MNRRSVLRIAGAITWVLVVAVLVILGVRFGWRVPIALVVAYTLVLLRLVTQPRDPGRLRTWLEFIIFALVGTALGAFAFGALGGIFGFAVGISARLGEVPIKACIRGAVEVQGASPDRFAFRHNYEAVR